jgi:hypothetical protein
LSANPVGEFLELRVRSQAREAFGGGRPRSGRLSRKESAEVAGDLERNPPPTLADDLVCLLGIDHFHSYIPILAVAALLPVLDTVALFVLGGSIRRITLEEAERPN